MNSFFASVEQQVRPELRGSPVGIIPNDCDTTCCIACSYEAKHHGVKTGTGVREAKRLCPHIRIVLSRPEVYIEHHHKIVEAVETVYPIDQVWSIDEMSCRLTGPDRQPVRSRELAVAMKRAIRERVGQWMRCSVGIAPNGVLAKTAGEMVKPDGLVVIEPHELPERLYSLALTDLPGINTGIERRLRSHGIYSMPELCAASRRRLREAWGSILGEAWWDWLHGHDPPVARTRRRNVGHQHVLEPKLRSPEAARAVAIRLLCKAAARMRFERFWATKLTLSVKPVEQPGWNEWINLEPCQDTVRLLTHLDELWHRRTVPFVFCIGVTLGGLVRDACVERPLFAQDRKKTELAHTMDAINTKHGHAKVYYGSMHGARRAAPMRIPFSRVPDLSLPDAI